MPVIQVGVMWMAACVEWVHVCACVYMCVGAYVCLCVFVYVLVSQSVNVRGGLFTQLCLPLSFPAAMVEPVLQGRQRRESCVVSNNNWQVTVDRVWTFDADTVLGSFTLCKAQPSGLCSHLLVVKASGKSKLTIKHMKGSKECYLLGQNATCEFRVNLRYQATKWHLNNS